MIGAEVFLWGAKIGTVVQEHAAVAARFNYDEAFLHSGIEVSPLCMPLSAQVYSFPLLSQSSFRGLPGLLADSLPDRFGNRLLEVTFNRTGRSAVNISSVERLCYTGSRGMGALEYRPALYLTETREESLDLDILVELASEVLLQREEMQFRDNDLSPLISVGTSAGGARAKAVVAWNRTTGDIRSGQASPLPGYEHWLIKFDGVSGNRDHGDKDDGEEFTRIEYAYHLMAVAAGIEMSQCELMQQNGLFHFATKRFDRVGETGEKLHMQTLGALAHYDFNEPGAHSYEQAAQVIYRLGMSQKEVEQLYRRMVFNVIARNQDDHVKNISFLMNRAGEWSLAPAYDVTYAVDPGNQWLRRHQMQVNGKLDNITVDDLRAVAVNMNISRRRCNNILDEVSQAVAQWPDFAEKAFVAEKTMQAIREMHLLNLQ